MAGTLLPRFTGSYGTKPLPFPGINNYEKRVNYNQLFIRTAWREIELLNYKQWLNVASLRPPHDESSTLSVGTDSPSQYGAHFTMHVDLSSIASW